MGRSPEVLQPRATELQPTTPEEQPKSPWADDALGAIDRAREVTKRLRHGFVGSAALIYGFATGDEAEPTAQVFRELGITPEAIEAQIKIVDPNIDKGIKLSYPLDPTVARLGRDILVDQLDMKRQITAADLLLGIVTDEAADRRTKQTAFPHAQQLLEGVGTNMKEVQEKLLALLSPQAK